MLDYKLLEALTAVVEQGGFERAARRLNITQSAVSQRVRLLETTLGQPVLARTQPPSPTSAGPMLLRHARRVELLEAELGCEVQEATQAKGWRTLAVGINADSLATWFVAAVLPLVAQEGITFDVKSDDQERTQDLLRKGEVAGCVSTRETAIQGCRAVFLGVMRYHCACTPEFAERWFPLGLILVQRGWPRQWSSIGTTRCMTGSCPPVWVKARSRPLGITFPIPCASWTSCSAALATE
jgi:LysR family transcriptional regulator (chromosome initiation inhibitor)